MSPSNHARRFEGILNTKSQASEAPHPESLQSKTPFARKIESLLKALRVFTGDSLTTILSDTLCRASQDERIAPLARLKHQENPTFFHCRPAWERWLCGRDAGA
jgi:hypothetical protein